MLALILLATFALYFLYNKQRDPFRVSPAAESSTPRSFSMAKAPHPNPHTNSTSIEDALDRHEFFQYIPSPVVKDLASKFEVQKIARGHWITTDDYGLSFILSGSATAMLKDETAKETIAKLLRAPDAVTPILQSLSYAFHAHAAGQVLGACHSEFESLRLHADTHLEIALLSVERLQSFVGDHPEAALMFTGVFLRRMFSEKLPFAQRYLGLQQDILKFEERLSKTHNDSDEHTSSSSPGLASLHQRDFRHWFGVPFGDSRWKEGMDTTNTAVKNSGAHHTPLTNVSRHEEAFGKPSIKLQIPPSLSSGQARMAESNVRSALSQLESEPNFLDSNSFPTMTGSYSVKTVITQTLVDVLLSRAYMPHESILSAKRDVEAAMELLVFPPGVSLTQEGLRLSGLFFVVDGLLETYSHTRNMLSSSPIRLTAGSLLGYNSVLSNSRALNHSVTLSQTYIAFISRKELISIVAKYPAMLTGLAIKTLSALGSTLSRVHYLVDYTSYKANELVYQEGEVGASFFHVVNGRFKVSVQSQPRARDVKTEFARGDSFGALELFPASSRLSTIAAVRHSHTLRVQQTSLNFLSQQRASLLLRFLESLQSPTQSVISKSISQGLSNSRDSNGIHTISIITLGSTISGEEFSSCLADAFGELGISIRGKSPPVISAESLQDLLVTQKFPTYGLSTLDNYMAQIEDNTDLAIYLSDATMDISWSKTCVSRADVILYITDVTEVTEVSELESSLAELAGAARQCLVLVHGERREALPGATKQWLKQRQWIKGDVHHVRISRHQDKAEVSKKELRVPALRYPQADFHRLARHITGNAIGLVLGGGGARGIAHLGVLKALEDYNIPVDFVGGTSIGAFIGSVFANQLEFASTYDVVRQFSGNLSFWRFAYDITYPWLAITSGRHFNSLIQRIVGDIDIEDHWLRYYCSVTNLSKKSSSTIISSGKAWDAIRASMSFIGFVPPLWREGQILLDGCYSSNVPVSYAIQMNLSTVFAVDVGADKTIHSRSWGTELSGWAMMFKRFFLGQEDPPSYSWVVEILTDAMSQADIESSRQNDICHYTKPPVGMYKGKDFQDFDAIFEIGYRHAQTWLKDLRERGELNKLCLPQNI